MKHLLSILIFLSFMSVAKAEISLCEGLVNPTPSVSVCKKEGCGFDPQSGMCVRPLGVPVDEHKNKCLSNGFYYSPSGLCDPYRNTDGSFKVKSTDYFQPEPNTEKENNELIVLIFLIFIGGFVTLLIINKSVKKTKEVYKSSTIPLKNKVKRKELETRLNELDEVKPAEHTYKKTAYVDDTEEINEVKKLERQIKIKKLQKELKDLEEE